MSAELEIHIKKMPDQKTLEDFLKGMSSHPTVLFNAERGEFEYRPPKPEKLGQPLTEQGEKWRHL